MNFFGIRLGRKIPSGATSPLKGVGKAVSIPSGETTELEGLETWQVTWYCRNSGSVEFPDHCPTGQLFTNENDALAFQKALREAYALVRNTVDSRFIKVKKM